MRTVLALFALLGCAAASSDRPAGPDRFPARDAGSFEVQGPDRADCGDRIETVRAERGLPRLEREPADPDEPLLIAAVHKQIDGCSVLVMRYDTSDVRPMPRIDGQEARLRPAR